MDFGFVLKPGSFGVLERERLSTSAVFDRRGILCSFLEIVAWVVHSKGVPDRTRSSSFRCRGIWQLNISCRFLSVNKRIINITVNYFICAIIQ